MSDEERALVPIEQREVEFYGDELTAVRAEDGQVYVAIRQMCNALGLDDRSQRRRIQRHKIMSQGYQGGVITTPPFSRRSRRRPPRSELAAR
jgi:hypothetical protein